MGGAFVVEVDPVLELGRRLSNSSRVLWYSTSLSTTNLSMSAVERVPHEPVDQVVILVEQGGRRALRAFCWMRSQMPHEETGSPGSSSSDFPSATVRTMSPIPLGRIRLAIALRRLRSRSSTDPAGDPDVVHGGHQHQVASRNREIAGDHAGALGADRLLGHLDDDVLAFLQHVLDGLDVAGRGGVVLVAAVLRG